MTHMGRRRASRCLRRRHKLTKMEAIEVDDLQNARVDDLAGNFWEFH